MFLLTNSSCTDDKHASLEEQQVARGQVRFQAMGPWYQASNFHACSLPFLSPL